MSPPRASPEPGLTLGAASLRRAQEVHAGPIPFSPPFQFSKDVLVNIYSAYIDNFLNAKDAVRIAKEARPAFMKFLEVGPGSSLPIGAGRGPESLAKLLVGQGGVNGSKLVTYGQTGIFHTPPSRFFLVLLQRG